MNDNTDYLNPAALDGLAQFLDHDKQLQLLDRYLLDSQQLIVQLEDALAEGDAAEARRMVHSLKSTSANLGAMILSNLSKELEMLAVKEKLDEIQSRVTELKDCFIRTSDAINQLEIMQSRKTE